MKNYSIVICIPKGFHFHSMHTTFCVLRILESTKHYCIYITIWDLFTSIKSGGEDVNLKRKMYIKSNLIQQISGELTPGRCDIPQNKHLDRVMIQEYFQNRNRFLSLPYPHADHPVPHSWSHYITNTASAFKENF
jgi:hypothetical protein